MFQIMLSVISPVYNTAKYLAKCVDSICNQTLKNLEIIFVDDGSTDGSDKIIEEYASTDSRITLIRQDNLGAGAARNRGLKHATGKYIHFLDSDDWLELNAYEIIVNKLESSGCDTCIFQKYLYDNESGEITPSIRAFRTNDYITNFKNNPSFFIHSPVVPWNKITRREVIEKNNIKYDEIACGNDRTFYFHLIKSCSSVMVCRDLLLYYRVNNSKSTVGTNRSINYSAQFEAYYSTMSKYKGDPEDIQRLVADACITDLLFFFDKSDLRYKKKIYSELHHFFSSTDFSIFHDDFNNYSWGKRFDYIRKHPDCPPDYLTISTNSAGSNNLGETKVCGKVIRPKEEVIVSLTSFPARIGTIVHTLKSIIYDQTVKADRIVLWLAESQFPSLESELPKDVLDLKRDGLEIRFCDDLKPHKKYYYVMQENPNSIIITIDDDLIYSPDTIESLLKSYILFPRCISARRVHRIQLINGAIAPYSEWGFNDDTFYYNPSMQAMATGVGGVLYPPNIMPEETFRKDVIIDTCLFADDLWLKINEVRNGVPTVLCSFNRPLEYVDGSQEIALWKSNKNGGENDNQLHRILSYYSDYDVLSSSNGIYSNHSERYLKNSVLINCNCGFTSQFIINLEKQFPQEEKIFYNVDSECYTYLNGLYYCCPNVKIISNELPELPMYAIACLASSENLIYLEKNTIDLKRLVTLSRKTVLTSKIVSLNDVSTQSKYTAIGNSQDSNASSDALTTLKYSHNLFLEHRKLCPICGNYVDSFEPAGLKLRDNVVCQRCGSFERHRALWLDVKLHYKHGCKILCVSFPSKIELLFNKNNVSAISFNNINKITGLFDIIAIPLQLRAIPDLISLFESLKKKMSDTGCLLVNIPIVKNSNEFVVPNTPLTLNEFRWMMEDIGLSTELQWNKDIFNLESMELYSLVNGELILLCQNKKSVDSHMLMPSMDRFRELAKAYSSESNNYKNVNMVEYWCSHLANAEKTNYFDFVLERLWELNDDQSIEKIKEINMELLKKDSVKAKFYVGKMYQTGRGVKKDLRIALTWFKSIMDVDENAEYEYALTLLYTLKQENIKEFFTIAENTDNIMILDLAAKTYDEGKIVKKDEKQALAYYERSSELGSLHAKKKLKEYCLRQNADNVATFRIIMRGMTMSEKELERCLRKDNSIESSKLMIFNYCNDESLRGNLLATYFLAKAYEGGVGVESDMEKAKECRSKLKKVGYSVNENELTCLLWEICTSESFYELLNVINNRGDSSRAMQLVGRAYRDGTGLDKNMEKASIWMEKAYTLNNQWVNEYLSVLWDIHTTKSLEELCRICAYEIDQGNAIAARYLARTYQEQGKNELSKEIYRKALYLKSELVVFEYTGLLYKLGEENDLKECIEICETFSKLGNKDALFRLGQAYLEGKGVEPDVKKAEDYLLKAKELGSTLAEKYLEKLRQPDSKKKSIFSRLQRHR